MCCRYLLAVTLCLVSCFARAIDPAEQVVRQTVAQLGLSLGATKLDSQLVFVGLHKAEMEHPSKVPMFLLVREKDHKIAELKAKAELLRFLRQLWSGREEVKLFADDKNVDMEMTSAVDLFAKSLVSGWYVLCSAERYENGVYSVAVAVTWSLELEKAGRAARDGCLPCSKSYKTELDDWLKKQDIATWTGTRVFVDSAGFPHLLGVGVGDVGDSSRLWLKQLQMKTELWARKNLMLGLYGDAEASKVALERMSMDETDSDSESFYEGLANIEVKNEVIDGISLVVDGFVRHPITGRKMLVTIDGVLPRIRPSHVAKQNQTGGVSPVMNRIRHSGMDQSGIMTWNPNTGKFEKQGQ
jgi:hypothetical protein